MLQRTFRQVCSMKAGWIALLAVGGVALAHHSNVAFEVNTVMTVAGGGKEFRWPNPHPWWVLAAWAHTPPGFSGVCYPITPFGAAAGAAAAKGKQKGPPARPTRSAPLSDGSQGRSPDAPALTAEYMAKWQMISNSRIAGSY